MLKIKHQYPGRENEFFSPKENLLYQKYQFTIFLVGFFKTKQKINFFFINKFINFILQMEAMSTNPSSFYNVCNVALLFWSVAFITLVVSELGA